MERIATILAIFVLLMNGRHVEHRRPQRIAAITIQAQPIPLDASDPARTRLGALRYLGGWALTSDHPAFGGISSMHFAPDGRLITLNDSGEIVTFRPGSGRIGGLYRPVPAFAWEAQQPKWRWDTESMTVDPVTGQVWVGIELTKRICRYARDFAKVERCVYPPSIQAWPDTTGIESLQRLPDGRFLGIAEEAVGPYGGHDVVLFARDPTGFDPPSPVHLAYRAPEGYLPTDALWLGHGRMLVINRRLTLLDGFTGMLALAEVGDPHAGQILAARVVAQFSAPVSHDNFEALALTFEHGAPVLWIASDDNHLFFQQTLLLKFALPQDWFQDVSETNRSR